MHRSAIAVEVAAIAIAISCRNPLSGRISEHQLFLWCYEDRGLATVISEHGQRTVAVTRKLGLTEPEAQARAARDTAHSKSCLLLESLNCQIWAKLMLLTGVRRLIFSR